MGEKHDRRTCLPGGMKFLPLPLDLVNGGGSGQNSQVSFLSPAVCQKPILALSVPLKILTRAKGHANFHCSIYLETDEKGRTSGLVWRGECPVLQSFCLSWRVPASLACVPSQLWGLLMLEDVSNL